MPDKSIKTPFYDGHVEDHAKIVPFAGFMMPLNYADGIIREHEWVRTRAGLFDVSHMGQCFLEGADAAKNLSRLTPTSFKKTDNGRSRYTVLTNHEGGVVDDLIITRINENLFYLVINASCREKDIAWINDNLEGDAVLTPLKAGTPLLAIQGPCAEQALKEALLPNTNLEGLLYMHGMPARIMGIDVFITRTGYTGEDGFEISIPNNDDKSMSIWRTLVQHEDIRPIGLGARDSLRLEMGFPLYGHDMDTTTSPIEADIKWVVNRKNEGFIGHNRIKKELTEGVERKRIGVKITEKGVAREGAKLLSPDGHTIGILTSGGFSPSTKQSIGQGYVESAFAEAGKIILVEVRNRRLRAVTHELNFINPRPIKPSA